MKSNSFGPPAVRRITRILAGTVFLAVFGFASGGCASTRKPAVPETLTRKAEVPGFDGVRLAIDTTQFRAQDLDPWLTPAVSRVRSGREAPSMLALSGGGPDGAYGAGVLNGWTRLGNRPEFDIVTGVSTGSLIAPFAFLGPDYDERLKKAYTSITDGQVFRKRSFFGILFNGLSVADSKPLFETILNEFDDAVLAAIAVEYRKGRRLYVGSTDMDAEALMCWDLGVIAASGKPGSRELFCRALLASASIPVAFPPVFIDVEAAGRPYQEMHCDGGCMTQVFGAFFLTRLCELSGISRGNLYVIRNEVLATQWQDVGPEMVKIGGRAIDLLLRNQGIGDLYRAYLVAQESGLNFNLTYIPGSFVYPDRHGQFDPGYMNSLFDLGFHRAETGEAWTHHPPAARALDGRTRAP